MRNYLIVVAILVAGSVSAQVSFNAGSSTLKGFGTDKWFTGFHVGVEVPRDDAMSFYGRYTHHFARTGDSLAVSAVAMETTTTPYVLSVMSSSQMNYNIFEGGTRYYLGDGFDFGFAGYGGTSFMIVYNKVKTKYTDFDETKYEIDGSTSRDGAIFSLGAGLLGGVKYTVPRVGTFYSDFSVSYMLLGQASENSTYTGLYSNLFFGINIGYRRDLFW
ncbi:MAG: hypothetical protein P8P74_17900 [Crocinitomicaceae bacterium]|nr:hypothetical protein [Crocinitomicaceae bacterium]